MANCALQIINFNEGITVSEIYKLLDCIGISGKQECLPVDIETDVGCVSGFIRYDAAENINFRHADIIRHTFESLMADNDKRPDETGAIYTTAYTRNMNKETIGLNIALFL